MIKEPLSASIECLTTAKISHALFVASDKQTLYLFDTTKFEDALELLQSRGVIVDSIIRDGNIYLIHF